MQNQHLSLRLDPILSFKGNSEAFVHTLLELENIRMFSKPKFRYTNLLISLRWRSGKWKKTSDKTQGEKCEDGTIGTVGGEDCGRL